MKEGTKLLGVITVCVAVFFLSLSYNNQYYFWQTLLGFLFWSPIVLYIEEKADNDDMIQG